MQTCLHSQQVLQVGADYLCILNACGLHDLFSLIGRQMFEKDASLALSDAKFLTEGMIY